MMEQESACSSKEGRYFVPDWLAPSNVRAFVTQRSRATRGNGGGGGAGKNSTVSFNMSTGSTRSEEEQAAVLENRALMARDWQWSSSATTPTMPTQQQQQQQQQQQHPQWLWEVHGTSVVQAEADGIERKGDAVWTDRKGLPIIVLSADCLPVIFCTVSGTKVAAAHAGWRGLAAGVLEETVDMLDERAEDIMAWLGPAISQTHFEVGPEVQEAFLSADPDAESAFVPGKGDRWHGDLFALARMRLKRKGVGQVYGGGLCTFRDPERWFSYRRDGPKKGNFATVVWLEQ